MELKLYKKTFNVDKTDRVLDNGKVYILLTKTFRKGGKDYCPDIPKTTFNNLKKAGTIVKSNDVFKAESGEIYDLYEFAEDHA